MAPDGAARPQAKPDWAMSRGEVEAARRARDGLPPRRRRWPWVVLVLVLLAAAAAGWQYRDALMAQVRGDAGAPPAAGGAPAEGAPEAAAAPVQVNQDEWATIEPQTLRRTIKVIGPLAPVRRADLSSETGGEVEEVAVRPGDAVTAGQILVRVNVERLSLDLDLARANAESIRAQLALAEGQLVRAQALIERGVAAESTLDDPETQVASLQAELAAQRDQVASAELALGNADVTAPFDGMVATRTVDEGAVVSPGAALLSVVDLSEVEMLAAAPVAAGARIRPGQVVDVEVDGVEGRVFQGEVLRIAPVAEEGTRTITIYVRLANPDGVLLGGMFATGAIVAEEAVDAVAVPAAALREDDEGAYVLVIAESAVARRGVTAGAEWEGGLVEIAEGLVPGDDVVIAALSGLEPGQPVELVEY